MPRLALGLALLALACASPEAPGDRLELVRGYQPETVVRGPEGMLYVGTLTGGGIEAVDLSTRAVRWVVEPLGIGERAITGIAYDAARHQIVACGAWLSTVYVFDADTGALVSSTAVPAGLVNAVALRGDDAYFTESVHAVLYRALRDSAGHFVGEPVAVPLTGDFQAVAGLMELNSNGIVAPPGRSEVILAHSSLGVLYRVDPISGDARLVDLGDATLVGADGLLLDGSELLVVRNSAAGGVTQLELAPDLASARVIGMVTDARLRSPTSVVRDGEAVWVLSSRLLEIFHGVADPEDDFDLIRVPLPGGPRS